eukprot:1708750-Rhodomonas_salina.1
MAARERGHRRSRLCLRRNFGCVAQRREEKRGGSGLVHRFRLVGAGSRGLISWVGVGVVFGSFQAVVVLLGREVIRALEEASERERVCACVRLRSDARRGSALHVRSTTNPLPLYQYPT